MNMFTRLSAKGQLVLPKGMRDLKEWPSGTELEVIDAGEGVLLLPRKATTTKSLTIEQALTKLRALYTHRGPPVPVERLSWQPVDDDRLR